MPLDLEAIRLDAELSLRWNSRPSYDWSMRLASHCLALADEVERMTKQLPESMKRCTILFKECEKGHGWLTATNWVQHGCPTCESDALRARLTEIEEAAGPFVCLADELSSEAQTRDYEEFVISIGDVRRLARAVSKSNCGDKGEIDAARS